MNGNVLNNVSYTGIVSLSQYHGKSKVLIEKIENAGGMALFDFLAECIIGNFDSIKLERPTKIMLLKKYKNEITGLISYKSASDFIYMLNQPTKVYNPTGSAVCFSFIIPIEYLRTDFDAVGLYSSTAGTQDADKYSAVCSIPNFATTRFSSSSVLIVDWQLNIHNSPRSTTNEDIQRA